MKKLQSIDGFILRKNPGEDSPGQDGLSRNRHVYLDRGQVTIQMPQRKPKRAEEIVAPTREVSIQQKSSIREDNLDMEVKESLANMPIDQTADDNKIEKKRRRGKRDKKSLNKLGGKKHRIIKRLIIVALILGVLGLVAGFLLKAFGNIGKMFEGNPLDIFSSNVPLEADKNGRTNILMLGTADDEAGHDGGKLTDSIMIMSIDQDKHDAYTVSIPRDLWVSYGQACPAGYKGKINAAYSCYGGATGDVEKDKAALKKSITLFSGITGVDIQYAVNFNYTVFRDVVNAIGGSITVNIESRNSRGILDSTFDWKCGNTKAQKIKTCPPDGHFLQLPNGEQTLDAEHALYLALARGHGSPTYGLEQSNFDREKNQQLVIRAIMDKAKSNGSFTNISTVMSLIDSMGTNLRTTIASKYIKTFVKVAQNFDADNMNPISLIDADPAILTTGNISGQSVVVPVAGTFEYGALQSYIAKNLSNDPAIKENPKIYVYNGGAASGSATTIAGNLTDKGYKATVKGNVEDVDSTYAVYDLTGGKKSGSSAALKKMFNVDVKQVSADKLPSGVDSKADFIVVLGTQAVISENN